MSDSAPDFDFIVIGSGFGGSVSAHRLVEKGYRVAVMEMGRRWTAGNLPHTNWRLWRWIWRPGLALRGFFNIEPFRHVIIMHGCAVGGGSITYANTLLQPGDAVWERGSWAGLADWKSQMPGHFQTARRMLGVIENRILGPADHILRRAAEAAGAGHTFYRTQVAVFEPPEGAAPGEPHPDPYFDGAGPPRHTCTGCGGCMMGCRYNAKNTLDKNYLYLAEKGGARLFAETRVVDVAPAGENYIVRTERSTAFFRKHRRSFTARSVVFAGSALGTMDLLFRLKRKGSLPLLSDCLGKRVRTNAESLIGVRVPGSRDDLSLGIAIGSGIYIDEFTHIEATRYPAGSDAMGLLATLLTGGRPGRTRILHWIATCASSLLRHPIRTVRSLHPFGWARESLILLCMQTLDGHIDMRLGRPWFWPFHPSLMSHGPRIPTYIPQANDFARKVAATIGGTPMSMVTEILFNVPGTAHILGGCPMGESPEQGVVDHQQRLFGYRNLYVCDGSVIAANLGVNPSLTICALTERAMTFIPPKIPSASG
ncbi:MAG: GMC family oxidoreductase [Candidatus Sulfopaludibacter sp.]|nr:GMC family oxidoreductase [Candidatus Sulfopaludibacter sp.]